MTANQIDDVIVETDIDVQLAENQEVDNTNEENSQEFNNKRKLLEKTKIVRQSWSIIEIFQKIQSKILILDPDYQRQEIWSKDKQTSFIESLLMGIMVPPIYVSELPLENILTGKHYEVVDGKQRLTAIRDFLNEDLKLSSKHLEYYGDIFPNKKFSEVRQLDDTLINETLSSVLDIYVITVNSPDFTKYDIFARLNKGSEPLKVNEIRHAIYHSAVSKYVADFIKNILKDPTHKHYEKYTGIFTPNDIKRYEDYGRFYRSIAFYIKTDIDNNIVQGYNSRPREMINSVLEEFQAKTTHLPENSIDSILNATITLSLQLASNSMKDYLIDAIIPFLKKYSIEDILAKIQNINDNQEIQETLNKSPATTSNVTRRCELFNEILKQV